MAEPQSGSESCRRDQTGEEFALEIGDIHEQRAICPGEEDDVERQAVATLEKRMGNPDGQEDDVEQAVAVKGQAVPVDCTVWNDLKAAAELELGSGWQIIYPEAKISVAMPSDDHLQVSVRLRDDVKVSGTCTAVPASTLMLSASFGVFGDQAAKQIRKEEREAEQESLLREQRQKEIDQQMNQEVSRAIVRRQKVSMISIWLCTLLVLGAMVACAVATFSLATELQGLGLAVVLQGLISCAGCGVAGLGVASGVLTPHETNERMRKEVRAERPDLRRFEDTGVETDENVLRDWRLLTVWSCVCCVPVVVLGCMVAMTVVSGLDGYGGASAVLWGPVALMMCCGGVGGWLKAGDEGAGWSGRAGNVLAGALLFPIAWPFALSWLLFACGFARRFTALLLKPAKQSLDAAVHTTHEHTIVFEGNVLPGRETVCSWPGKYATAWDTLVAGSKQDDISAAVVFLPEGSKDFGLHDPIPASQDLRDLHGECWCTPLYGERKPWGCRWWSKWISNVEQAASQQCTLEVYYFNGMRGKGKVKDFTTAGEEHMRREAIERRRDAFLKSGGFSNALEAGLKHLPKEKGPDSSSPYSREVQRLFLAWLPEEDRQFLASSEGIGNSQKAEVAWLERKGYSYIEREVRELESSSPKAIGRATE